MEIHTHSFCGISQSEDWQTFLAETDPELHAELMITLNQRKGCRTNSQKMQEIYVQLYDKGHGPAFEDFITRRFPWLIKSQKPADPKKTIEKHQFPAVPIQSSKPFKPPHNDEDMNRHKVFKSYRPSVLSFPQKLIFAGNPDTLLHRVQAFCRDKLAVDWIIIEDRAYVEYFHPKYANIINRIPREKREIFQYRKKLEQNG